MDAKIIQILHERIDLYSKKTPFEVTLIEGENYRERNDNAVGSLILP